MSAAQPAAAAPLKVTSEQAEQLFREIAYIADAARHLAMGAVEEVGEGISADALIVLAGLLVQTGALADLALGGDVIDSFSDWACGPRFKEAGQ